MCKGSQKKHFKMFILLSDILVALNNYSSFLKKTLQ